MLKLHFSQMHDVRVYYEDSTIWSMNVVNFVVASLPTLFILRNFPKSGSFREARAKIVHFC